MVISTNGMQADWVDATYHVCKGKEDKYKGFQLVQEETAKETKLLEHPKSNALRAGLLRRLLYWLVAQFALNSSEVIDRQSRFRRAIKFSNLVQDINGVLFAALTE